MPTITIRSNQEPVSSCLDRAGEPRYLYCADDGAYWWWCDSGWFGPYGPAATHTAQQALDLAFANIP